MQQIDCKQQQAIKQIEEVKKGAWGTIDLKEEMPCIREILKDELENQQKENCERETRESNIIIHQVTECDDEDWEKRKEHDTTFFKDLCGGPLEIGDIQIKDIFRLGNRNTTKQAGKRPIKVVLNNKEDKARFMSRLYRLKTAEPKFNKISVRNDMTKEDRERTREKVQEAKNLKTADKSGEWNYLVRGPPGNLKIVKVRAHRQQ